MSSGPSPARLAIQQEQLEKLNHLIQALHGENRFYTSRLRAAGLERGVESLEEYFERMPFTTKQEIVEDQVDHPPHGTNLTFPLERYTRFNQTSGTTGAPLRWLDTPESWSWMVGNWERVFEAAGVNSSDHVFFAFSFGPFLGFWTSFDAALRRGCLALPGGGMSTGGRLRTLLDNQATVVCCTPTYAIRMGETARSEGIHLADGKVRALIVAGEPGGSIPSTRKRIEELWPGSRVFDHHGMTEVGPVSFESPTHPGVLHVIESSFIAEVLHPETLSPVEPGGIGELVLTNLGRVGSPLLRYRTGDIVNPVWDGERVFRRPELALVGGILGRVDDMVIVRGVNVSPAALEDVIHSRGDVAEYRVEISTLRGLTEMRVVIEPDGESIPGHDLRREIETALRTAFSLRIPVQVVPPGSLPRFEMKAQRWVRVETHG